MGRIATVLLPMLTLILGIAIGRWWSDRDRAAQRGRDEAARGTERRAALPPGPEPPRRADVSGPSASSPTATDPVRETAPTPASLPKAAHAAKGPEAATDAARNDGVDSVDTKAPTDTEAAKAGGNEEAAAKMLAVLFTNPAFRDRIVDQMVAQVGQRVTFSDSQREAAKKELAGALQPLVDLFQKGPVDMKDLDPKFQVVKEDWKRRLTPLLTAEQGLAFQKWLDEKHSLSVKMGMDEKGDPVDPDEEEK